MTRYSRRTLLKAGAAFAGVSTIGCPAIVSAQAARIKIGHLVPLTGFLVSVAGWRGSVACSRACSACGR